MQNIAPCSRRALTTVNCGAQLVHMRDRTVEASLAVLEKLNTWFMPSHYTVIEVKMCIIKEWGDMVTLTLQHARRIRRKEKLALAQVSDLVFNLIRVKYWARLIQ